MSRRFVKTENDCTVKPELTTTCLTWTPFCGPILIFTSKMTSEPPVNNDRYFWLPKARVVVVHRFDCRSKPLFLGHYWSYLRFLRINKKAFMVLSCSHRYELSMFFLVWDVRENKMVGNRCSTLNIIKISNIILIDNGILSRYLIFGQ